MNTRGRDLRRARFHPSERIDMRPSSLATAAALACAAASALPLPAAAQSTGYVTGFPGKDPAGDDAIGWGPAYRPETSFSQPGTPPTPGDFAGAAYRARSGRGPYDDVQETGQGTGQGIGPAGGPDCAAPASRPTTRSRACPPGATARPATTGPGDGTPTAEAVALRWDGTACCRA